MRVDASEVLQERHAERMQQREKLKEINAGGPEARRQALRAVSTCLVSIARHALFAPSKLNHQS